MVRHNKRSIGSAGARFESTQWSVVLAAGHESSPDSRKALETLCRAYWYPLYAYVRRRGYGVHESEDLVQGFFARLLDKNVIAVADPNRGRFRSFLLTAVRNFIANEQERMRAQKRGGGAVPVSIEISFGESKYFLEPDHGLTPERLYDRQWAVTLLDRVMAQLRDEFVRAGKVEQFDCLKGHLAGPDAAVGYAEAADRLGISKGAAMTAVSRLRHRYRELLRSEIAGTVSHPEEVEDEILQLFNALGG